MNRSITKTFSISGLATLAALGLTASPAFAPPAAAQQGANQLDQAVAALRGISTMQANFTQTDRNGQTVSGVLTLKRPGKIRFQYEKGVPLLIVSDGKSLYFLDYEVNQRERWPIGNSPLGALLDPNRDVAKYGKLQPTGNPNVVSVEVRDKSHPEYGVITLIFIRKAGAPGGLELSSWVMVDSQNRRTTIRLSGQRYGVAVGDDTFRFNDPRRPSRR
jgi:outer membrane lipoprotein-sorting protein